jgi:serine/threonine-protein kinase
MLQGPTLDQAPLKVGKYRIIAKLGEGGMAHVFLAVAHGPIGFSRLSVLKVVRPHLAEDPEILQMFLDEARLAGRLNHANVVQTYEVGEEDGRYVLVMEYLEGQPLRSLQRRTKENVDTIPLPLQLKILVDALSGLHYAHELREYDGTPLHLVHRDVSPHNIFVTYDGQVKVLDFGIAKAATSSQETKSGVIKGKVSYMAPEQFETGPVDRRADIYSMGAILWQTATGFRMWRGVTDAQVMFAVSHGQIPRPSEVKSNVPGELDRICMRALAVNPDDRYPTAEAMQKDLRAFASELSTAVSALELGAFVAREFAQERRDLRDRIEQQLSRSAETGGVVPLVNLHNSLQYTGSSAPRWSGGSGTPSSMRRPLASAPPYEPAPATGSRPRLDLTPSLGSLPAPSTFPSGPPARVSVPHPNGNRSASRKGILIAAAAGGLVALGGVGGLAAHLLVSGTAPVASTANASTSMSAPIAAPQPVASETGKAPSVEIEIRVTPAHAKVFLDGRALAGNPAIERLPKEDRTYEVRIEAAGYAGRTMQVSSNRSTMVEVELKRERVQPGGRTAPSSEPAEPKSDSKAPPAKTTKPDPGLKTDNIDPWSQ